MSLGQLWNYSRDLEGIPVVSVYFQNYYYSSAIPKWSSVRSICMKGIAQVLDFFFLLLLFFSDLKIVIFVMWAHTWWEERVKLNEVWQKKYFCKETKLQHNKYVTSSTVTGRTKASYLWNAKYLFNIQVNISIILTWSVHLICTWLYCGVSFMWSEADVTYTKINYLISAANTISLINGLSYWIPGINWWMFTLCVSNTILSRQWLIRLNGLGLYWNKT